MKKLARKLVLSAMAMGLAVATLSTTTYAWYVSNTEATVDGLQGFTATVNDPNLLVAKNNKENNKPEGGFLSGIPLDVVDVNLKPVTLEEDEKTFKDQDGVVVYTIGGVNGDKAAPFVDYKFWVLTTNASTIYVTGELSNTTKDWEKVKQTVYAFTDGILPNEVANTSDTEIKDTLVPKKVGDKFAVDALRAINVSVLKQPAEDSSLDEVTLSGEETEIGNGGCITGFDASYTSPQGLVAGGDANKYYQQILGTAPHGTTDGTSKGMDEIDLSGGISIDDGIPTLITIRFWLDGAVAGCWNSCVGQTFTLSLTLSTTNPAAKG